MGRKARDKAARLKTKNDDSLRREAHVNRELKRENEHLQERLNSAESTKIADANRFKEENDRQKEEIVILERDLASAKDANSKLATQLATSPSSTSSTSTATPSS